MLASDNRIFYSIAFVPRSGSTEICSILTKLGLGVPTEYFQRRFAPDPERVAKAGGFDALFADFVASNSVGRVFGSKMSHDQRAQFEGDIRTYKPDVAGLSDYLPNHRWVWLKRRDKVMQAISLCKAETAGIWHGCHGEKSPDGTQQLEYDYFFLLSRVEMLCISDLAWQLYFEQRHEAPLVVYYEDFFADPVAHMRRLIDFLGLEPSGYDLQEAVGPTLRVLRTPGDAAMKERFVADLLEVGAPGWRERHGEDLAIWEAFFAKRGWRLDRPPGERDAGIDV